MAKTKSQNTTKELLNKTAENFEETVVGTEEVAAGAEAKYIFVHEDEYLYIPDINRRNMGHQFVISLLRLPYCPQLLGQFLELA